MSEPVEDGTRDSEESEEFILSYKDRPSGIIPRWRKRVVASKLPAIHQANTSNRASYQSLRQRQLKGRKPPHQIVPSSQQFVRGSLRADPATGHYQARPSLDLKP